VGIVKNAKAGKPVGISPEILDRGLKVWEMSLVGKRGVLPPTAGNMPTVKSQRRKHAMGVDLAALKLLTAATDI